MTSVNVTTTKNTVTVNGETRVVTVKTAGPQGPAFANGTYGDIVVSNDGADLNIATGAIVNADISNSAGIQGSKILPSFGSQNVTTSGNFQCGGGVFTFSNDAGGKIRFLDTNNNPDYTIESNQGLFQIYQSSGDPIIKVNTDKQVDINYNLDLAAGLDVTGVITGTSHLDLPDDAKLKLGDNDEFEIFHRGSDGVSLINEYGGGYLSLGSNGSRIEMYDIANSRTMAQFNTGGACVFKHAADIRLETTSTGVDVTGGVTWSAQSNVTGTIDFAADTLATYTPTDTGNGTETATDVAIALRRGHQIAVQNGGFLRNLLGITTGKDILIGQNNTNALENILLMPGSAGTVQLFYDGHNNSTPKLATSATGVSIDGSAAINNAISLTAAEGSFEASGATGLTLNASNANAYARIRVAGNTRLYIKNDGKIGIGNENPSAALDVTGDVTSTTGFAAGTTSLGTAVRFHAFSDNTHIGHQIIIEQDGAGDAVLGWALTGTRAWSAGIDNSDSNKWKLSSGSSVDTNTQITIEQDGYVGLHHDSASTPKLKTISNGVNVDGNLGIGTATPNRMLHIVSNGTSKIALTDSDITAETNSLVGGIDFTTTDTNNAGISAQIGAYHEDQAGNAYLRFNTGNASNAPERMRIKSDGTIIPSGTLEFASTLASYDPTEDGGGSDTSTTTPISLMHGHSIAVNRSGHLRNLLKIETESNGSHIEIGRSSTDYIGDIKLLPGNGHKVIANYDGSPKLETSATGVTVDGTLTAKDIKISDVSPSIEFQDTNADTDNQRWDFKCGGSNDFLIQALTDAGGGGGNLFKFTRDGNAIQTFIGQRSGITWLTVDNLNKKVTTEKLDVTNDLAVDTDTLFVDSTNDRVGINNASPTQALDVTGQIRVFSTTGGGTTSGLAVANSHDNFVMCFAGSNANLDFVMSYGGSGGNDIAISHQGAVKLSYGGSTTPKLATTAAGVNVTGDVVATGHLRNSVPTDFWNSGSYFEVGDLGHISTHGGFEFTLTSGGYRRQVGGVGKWKDITVDGQSGFGCQVALAPKTGKIHLRSNSGLSTDDNNPSNAGLADRLVVSTTGVDVTGKATMTESNASTSNNLRKITTSTAQPSGGNDGDIWIVVPS